MPIPKKCDHTMLDKFLEKNGFSGEAIHSASTALRSWPRLISGLAAPKNTGSMILPPTGCFMSPLPML